MQDLYTAGDRVQLKSGSITMIVKHEMSSGKYECEWYDSDTKEYRTAPFEAEKLVAAPSIGWGDMSANDLGIGY